MVKISSKDIVAQFESGVDNYESATRQIGLWASEEALTSRYFEKTDHILDIGCGTGRTTLALYQGGFESIVGIDLTPAMINAARKLAKVMSIDVEFQVGDATSLEFSDEAFDAIFFSFNGLFTIPKKSQRALAFAEIHRVLATNGHFIFTSHDRDIPEFANFWLEEQIIWKNGKQDERLYDFGDRIASSKNEEDLIYIHIPTMTEVQVVLRNRGFEVVDTFMRDDRYRETTRIQDFSSNCRFWITQKVSDTL